MIRSYTHYCDGYIDVPDLQDKCKVMKSNNKFWLTMLLCLIMMRGWAQMEPIMVQVAALPPFPVFLSEYEDKQNDLIVTLTNTDIAMGYDLKLVGSIRGDNGISIELPAYLSPAHPITLGPGEVVMMTAQQLIDLYPGLSEDDLIYSGGPQFEDVIQSQRIPDGNYTVCLQALDYVTGELRSAGPPSGCSGMISILTLEPPIVTAPLEGDEIDRQFPNLMTITWTPVVGAMTPIEYAIRIVEVPEGVNRYDAMASDNFLIFEDDQLMAPVLVYDESHPPLLPGKNYAIEVQAVDPTNTVAFRNEGRSEVVLFTINQGGQRNFLEREIPDFDCLSECLTPELPNVPELSDLLPEDIIKVGYFDMQITNAIKNGETFTGTGRILASEFLPVDINVDFQDVHINSEGYLTQGEARAINQMAGQAESELESELIQIGQNISQDINEAVLEGMQSIGLPFAIGISEIKLHITDLIFGPEGAVADILGGHQIFGDYADDVKDLIFKNQGICLTPGGFGIDGEDLKLYMDEDEEFQPYQSLGVVFHGGDDGSYLAFDCDGVQEIFVQGHVDVSREYIIPQNADGESYASGKWAMPFSTTVESLEDLIVELNPQGGGDRPGLRFTDRFELAALEDFSFQVENIVLDISELSNAAQASFPNNYPVDDTWQGLAIGEIDIWLPSFFESADNRRVHFRGEDLIIDGQGVSVALEGNDLINLDEGSIAEWAFSVDQIEVGVLRNSLNTAELDGQMRLPISDSPLDYTCTFSDQNGSQYLFEIGLTSDLEVPMWYSSISLDESSNIVAEVLNGEAQIRATLHGDLNFDDTIGDWDHIDIDGIGFQDLLLTSNAPYISGGNFDLNATGTTKFMGFEVQLSDLGLGALRIANDIKSIELDLGLDFEFGGDINGFSGGTNLKFLAQSIRSGQWLPRDVTLGAIEMNAEMSAVSIKGRVENFTNHATYGDGFRGELDATFLDNISLSAEAMFGTMRNYDYWYVDANIQLPAPVVFAPPMAFLGFSGGAYYNMSYDNDASGSRVGVGGGASYTPERGAWGLKAGTVLGIQPNADMVNANLGLEAEFSANGGLRRVELDGEAFIMRAPAIGRSQSGGSEAIKLAGSLVYNRRTSRLSGTFGYRVAVPASFPLILAEKLSPPSIEFQFGGADDWHIYLGQPAADGGFGPMIGFNFGIPFRILGKNFRPGFDANTYFCIGSTVPAPPPLPRAVVRHVGQMGGGGAHNVAGVAFGVHAAFNMPRATFKIMKCGVGFRASAGAGFDAHLGHYAGFTCNGRQNFGVNNWYATGQAYVYGEARLDGEILGIDFDILEVGFASAVRAKAPNPIWLSGVVSVFVDLPIVDGYRFRRGFTVGEACTIEDDEEANRQRLEDEAQEMDLITSVSVSQDEEVDILDRDFQVNATFLKIPGHSYLLRYGNEMLWYRINYDFDIYDVTGGRRQRLDNPEDFRHFVFRHNHELAIFNNSGVDGQPLLAQGRTYEVVIRAVLEARENARDPYQPMLDDDGNPVRDEVTARFETSEFEDLFIRNVQNVIPKVNERYFHPGDVYQYQAFINYRERGLLNAFGPNAEVQVRFTDVGSGNVTVSGATWSVQQDYEQIVYSVSSLSNGVRYRMDIVVTPEGGNPSIIYTQHFSTSLYERLHLKVQAISDNVTVRRTILGLNGESSYSINFDIDEPFDLETEPIRLEYMTDKPRSAWERYRNALVELATNYGFINDLSIPQEFSFVDPPQPPQQQGGGGGGGPFGFQLPNFRINYHVVAPGLTFNWIPDDYLMAIRRRGQMNPMILSTKENQKLLTDPFIPIRDANQQLDIRLYVEGKNIEKSFSFRI